MRVEKRKIRDQEGSGKRKQRRLSSKR